MTSYDATKWYWYVAGDQTKAFSSAVGDYVPANDATFVAWLANGNVPTRIDTEANLGGVLAPYYPNVQRPAVSAILDGYQQNQSDDIFTRKLSKLLFQMVNDIRQLKGQAAFTPAQARAYVKGLM